MKLRKDLIILILILIIALLIGGCAQDNTDTRSAIEALEKMRQLRSVHIKGVMDTRGEIEQIDMKININSDFDIKVSNENIQMSIKKDSDFDVKVSNNNIVKFCTYAGLIDVDMDCYIYDNKIYIYIPQVIEEYIDVSSNYEQAIDEGIGMGLAMFDFDAGSAKFEQKETTIKFQGDVINVLEINIMLNDEDMTKLIKDVYAQHNFNLDTLSGQYLDNGADIYESVEVESADYKLYIDKDNNIIRYEVDATFSNDVSGKKVKYDMKTQYDIIDTGDSVVIDIMNIQPDNVIDFEELTVVN